MLPRQTLEDAVGHGRGRRGDRASGGVLRGHELGLTPANRMGGRTLAPTGRGTGSGREVPRTGRAMRRGTLTPNVRARERPENYIYFFSFFETR